MPRLGFEPTSIQLHLQQGTFIRDAFPTELPRLQQLSNKIKIHEIQRSTFDPIRFRGITLKIKNAKIFLTAKIYLMRKKKYLKRLFSLETWDEKS